MVMGEVKQILPAKPGFPQKPGLWSRRKAQAKADAKLDKAMVALGFEHWREVVSMTTLNYNASNSFCRKCAKHVEPFQRISDTLSHNR